MAACHFSNPVRATRMIGSGHFDIGSEGSGCVGDAIVIGGDDDLVEADCLAASFPDVLEQWFARDEVQRFAWEAR